MIAASLEPIGNTGEKGPPLSRANAPADRRGSAAVKTKVFG
jgi:hypothetical protein